MPRFRLLFFLLSFTSITSARDKLTVTWLELPVHGLTVVLETPSGKVVLVDSGGVRKEPSYDAGRDTIAPFLEARGYDEIEAIVVSHPHGDHYGGAEWLMQNRMVKQYFDNGYEGRGQTEDYKRLRALATERGGLYRAVRTGDRIELDPALVVEVLSPTREFMEAASDPAKVSDHGLLNSHSVVLRVEHGENVFLFPGDSYGGAFELQIQAKVPPEKLKATVLTANHHGFNPGIRFPALVSPRYVVASCLADYPANADTPYTRSPGDKAIEGYGALGAEVFVTAFHGHVIAVSDGRTVTMTKSRDRAGPP